MAEFGVGEGYLGIDQLQFKFRNLFVLKFDEIERCTKIRPDGLLDEKV
jgi:hypothetical protein